MKRGCCMVGRCHEHADFFPFLQPEQTSSRSDVTVERSEAFKKKRTGDGWHGWRVEALPVPWEARVRRNYSIDYVQRVSLPGPGGEKKETARKFRWRGHTSFDRWQEASCRESCWAEWCWGGWERN